MYQFYYNNNNDNNNKNNNNKNNNWILITIYIYFLNQIKQTNFGTMEIIQLKHLTNKSLTSCQINFSQIKLNECGLSIN